ncbi:hypothetical protein [Spirillospora sp. CA-128828]|uniref:hypothetical protein n=1 Tax=Spirillospora sp. CA-128828 TaxID=3240033 RepID=UPI003D8EA444
MDTDEERDLRKLGTLLERVQQRGEQTGADPNASNVAARSPLAGDDAKTHPFELSGYAWHALTVATDHLECLRTSVFGPPVNGRIEARIQTHAQSSLVRGAIENGARAVWLLGPKDRPTRVTRRLALQRKEVKGSYRMRELVNQPATRTKEEALTRVNDLLAAALGTTADEAHQKLKQAPTYSLIVREAGDLAGIGADLAEVVWSGCSSLAHGDQYGTLGLLDKEVMARATVRGRDMAMTRVTGNISNLYWTTFAAMWMVEEGFRLYQARRTPYA